MDGESIPTDLDVESESHEVELVSGGEGFEPIDFEHYYPNIKDWTFETVFMPLFVEEARAILDRHKDTPIDESKDYSSIDKILQNLETRLDDELSRLRKECSWDGAFLRLSTRSPKDVALDSEEAQEEVIEAMNQARRTGKRPELAFLKASKDSYKVCDGKKCLWFLLRSRRTFSSLSTRLLQSENRNKYSMQQTRLSDEEFAKSKCISIVLRKFCPELKPEWEFRGFVWQFELQAVSQLYKWLHVPEIAKKRSILPQEIRSFYDSEIAFLLPTDLPNFIIDFVYIDGQWKVIELNRWDRMTGPALFSWQDEDRIKSGPFMFKIVPTPPVEPVDHLKCLYPWLPKDL